jgi:hypothetical protein
MKWPAVLLIMFPVFGWGEVRVPGGAREEKAGVVTVRMGFGSVSFPAGEAGEAARPEASAAGRRLACNRGTFSLKYRLARDGKKVRVRQLSVVVKNEAEYRVPHDSRLVEHERGHQRINEAAARRLEVTLAGFSADTTNVRKAEKLLKVRFEKELSDLQALHKEWDATSVIAVPAGTGY